MKHVLEREQLIARPRAEVFAFFANPANLDRLTPGSLHFQIRGNPPAKVVAGTIINYKISLLGVPFSWRTLIEEFLPGTRFVDVQVKGPYRSWRHQHDFSDVAAGTLVRDRVDYQLPLGSVGDWTGFPFVRRQLKQIFDFRRDTLAQVFGENL